LLNYLYAILEAQTRIALVTIGLDPALGFLHADLPNRDSLALDVMEVVRPQVDTWLVQLLQSRSFSARDFAEVREGTVRVTTRLTPMLGETAAEWAKAVAPVVEDVAHTLYRWWRGQDGRHRPQAKESLPTSLTQTRRSASRPSNAGTPPTPTEPKVTRTPSSRACKQCGGTLPSGAVVLCSDKCRKVYAREVNLPPWEEAGPAKLAELRAAGADPARTPEALSKLAVTQRERAAQRRAWDAEHIGEVFDEAHFRTAILPTLQGVPLSAMMRVTGLSLHYCAEVRHGKSVPHPMYWSELNKATEGYSTQ
jgi:hypothetical protein